MKKKILFTANLDSFFIKFLIPQLKFFKENNYEVYVASKSENIKIPYCDKKYNVDFARGFNIFQNIRSYIQMRRILRDTKYDIISTHTPFGGAITRIASNKYRKKGTRVIYMAHGFHFYDGCSKLKYLLFYNSEKMLAKYTDAIITINKYDYTIAKKNFKTKVFFVHGVGLDEEKFNFKMTDEEKIMFRKNLGLNKDSFVMIYPAEINDNKRQIWLINSLKDIFYNNKNFHLLLPGKDRSNGKCEKEIKKLGLKDNVHLLGFRNDIPKLLCISNLSLSSSLREGLPVNIMEAVYVGLPVVATECRGNSDLITNGKNGYIIGKNDKIEFRNKVLKSSRLKKADYKKIKELDGKIINKYLLNNVINDIIKIYMEDSD